MAGLGLEEMPGEGVAEMGDAKFFAGAAEIVAPEAVVLGPLELVDVEVWEERALDARAQAKVLKGRASMEAAATALSRALLDATASDAAAFSFSRIDVFVRIASPVHKFHSWSDQKVGPVVKVRQPARQTVFASVKRQKRMVA